MPWQSTPLQSTVKSLLINACEIGVTLATTGRMRQNTTVKRIAGCAVRPNPNNACLRRQAAALRPQRRHKEEHSDARGRMAVGGGPTQAPVVVGVPGGTCFHRLESPTQTNVDAATQVASMQIWGAAARGSGLPSVKAYRNTLPQRRGIEFSTPVAPTLGRGTPYEARWYIGTAGVLSIAARSGGPYAAIQISYIKNAQVP